MDLLDVDHGGPGRGLFLSERGRATPGDEGTERMIHFQCPACAARFDVDERLAGRAARCKRCGGRMKIPSDAANEAVRAACCRWAVQGGRGAPPLPRMDHGSPPSPPVAPSRPQPSLAAGRPINWLEAVNSQVALAPISMDNLRGLGNKLSPMDEPSIPGPYKLASAPIASRPGGQ